jgi:DNA-directed RNA polymerase II subunit RPB1
VRFTLTDAQAQMYAFTTANASGTTPASTPDATDSDAVVSGDPKVATTPVFTLDKNNPALTKSYTDQTVTATEGIDPTWDAGVVINKVSIGDYAWWDANRDGLQTAGEAVANLPVTLTLDGNVVATTTTDDNGYYAFANLEPSTKYVVTFAKPTGTPNDDAVFFTTQNAGGDASNARRATSPTRTPTRRPER